MIKKAKHHLKKIAKHKHTKYFSIILVVVVVIFFVVIPFFSFASLLKLYDFTADEYEGNPYGSLIQATDGNLYGMSSYNDSGNYGSLFKYNLSTNQYTKLHNLGGAFGDIIQIGADLYGMTENGGSLGGGNIFKYNLSSGALSTVHSFNDINQENGAHPRGSLMLASDGKLYGTTGEGGTYSKGVLFKFNITNNQYTKLHDFNDGALSYGSLIQASDDNLYGMTSAGGNGGSGVLYKYNISTNTYTALWSFSSISGSDPHGSLFQASDGNLYGMTRRGGINGYGIIFKYNISSNSLTKLFDFNSLNGRYPNGSFIEPTGNGILYGMAQGGLANGLIFTFNINSSNPYINIHDFDFDNGSNPFGSLMKATDGNLYGMTRDGGVPNILSRGVIFKYSISSPPSADPGFIVEPTSITVNEEGPTSETYTITIKTTPQTGETVTVSLTPSLANQITIPLSITFTPTVLERIITVQAIDDDIDETNTHTVTINHTSSSNISGSPYNNINPESVMVNILDNDEPISSSPEQAYWKDHTSDYPDGNTPTPIYVNDEAQTKSGSLITTGFISKGPAKIDNVGHSLIINLDQFYGGDGSGTNFLRCCTTGTDSGLAFWGTLPSNSGDYGGWTDEGPNTKLTHENDDLLIGLPTAIYKGTNRFIFSSNSLGADGVDTFAGMKAGLTFQNNEDHEGNVGVGFEAYSSSSSASKNTAVGYRALKSLSISENNVAFGAEALKDFNKTSGGVTYNTAVGYKSLSGLGSSSSDSNNNTALGAKTTVGSVNSHDVTLIGYEAGVGLSNLGNDIMIFGNSSVLGWGFGTQPGTYAIKVGSSSSNGDGARLTKDGKWESPSDRTKKHDIVDLSYGLEEVMKLRPVDFKWNGSNMKDFGFIAQEVKEILPEIVSGSEGDMGISYGQFSTVLTKAIQEQQQQLENDKIEIEEFEKQLILLEN